MEPLPTFPRFAVEFEIGRGTFSRVFSAADIATGLPVAVKVPINTHYLSQLHREAQILRHFSDCPRKCYTDIPKLVEFSGTHMYLATERVGKNLFDVRKERGKLTLKSVVTIAVECITAMEELHSKGFLHVDVKPDNFAIGLSETDTRVYLLDLGLSERFSIAGAHIQYAEGVPFQGSPYFSSISSLLGIRHSRRDDLEALGYVFLYLRSGDLPWFAEYDSEKDAITKIAKIREKTPLKTLCVDIEGEFLSYLTYCRSLRFDEKPNYDLLRGLFFQMAKQNGIEIDGRYDWTPFSTPKTPKKSPAVKSSRKSLGNSSTGRIREIKIFKLPTATPGALISALHRGQSRRSSADEDEKELIVADCETPLIPVNEVPALYWPREQLVEDKRKLLKQIV